MPGAPSSRPAVARAASGSPPDPVVPVLPARSRLTRRDEFASVLRGGRRSGRSRLVVHLSRVPGEDGPRAGFVVSRAVGGSVVRHRVSRRLRHLVAARLPGLPPDARVVVRALPPAAEASSAELAEDLDAGLRGALGKLVQRPKRVAGSPRAEATAGGVGASAISTRHGRGDAPGAVVRDDRGRGPR